MSYLGISHLVKLSYAEIHGLILQSIRTFDTLVNNIDYLSPDFGKLTELSHCVFKEIPISNTEATMVLSC